MMGCYKFNETGKVLTEEELITKIQDMLLNPPEEFKTAFDSADLVYVTDVFSAGEDEIEGATSENFVLLGQILALLLTKSKLLLFAPLTCLKIKNIISPNKRIIKIG